MIQKSICHEIPWIYEAFKMMKIGIFLQACGIKCSEEQAKKVEAFVDHFLKKHYIPKENFKTVKSLEKKEILP